MIRKIHGTRDRINHENTTEQMDNGFQMYWYETLWEEDIVLNLGFLNKRWRWRGTILLLFLDTSSLEAATARHGLG